MYVDEKFQAWALAKIKEQNEKQANKTDVAVEQKITKTAASARRAPDGSFTYSFDFVQEDENNETFTGLKLQTSFDEVGQVAEDALDSLGRNKMQKDLDFGENKGINLANPVAKHDAVNLETLETYIVQGTATLTDAGSNQAQGTIYLHLPYALENLNDGHLISFIAPFTVTVAQIKANESYEKIGLLNPNETIAQALIKAVARAPYVEDETYDDGIKDNRPTFIQGKRYTLQYRQDLDAWVDHDGNKEGQIITYNKNDTTPAGYIDLAYNYDGYGDVGEFNYIASYQPKLQNVGTESEPNMQQVSPAGKEEISMLAKHKHPYTKPILMSTGIGGTPATLFVNSISDKTGEPADYDISNVSLGDRIKPHTTHKRFLLKI